MSVKVVDIYLVALRLSKISITIRLHYGEQLLIIALLNINVCFVWSI